MRKEGDGIRGRKRTAKRTGIFILTAVLLAGIWLIFRSVSKELEVTFFHLYSPKIESGETIRVVVLSDLHNETFGNDNCELVEMVRALKPDLILMAGDMVNKDEDDTSTVLSLCSRLTDTAPVWYGLGNHEGIMIYERGIRLDQMLEEEGVHVLIAEEEELEVKGSRILIGSISADTENYEDYGVDFIRQYEKAEEFKLLITHFPDLYYEKLADADIDLGVCGHFHGGQVQLPVVGGLYSVDYGFFPKYCNGMFELDNSTIVVSRGLGNSHKIPRINNRPEIAVIDVNARETAE